MLSNSVKRQEELFGHSASKLLDKTNRHLRRIGLAILDVRSDLRLVCSYALSAICKSLAGLLSSDSNVANAVILVAEDDVLNVELVQLIERG